MKTEMINKNELKKYPGVNISNRDLKKMPELQISGKILNTEGKLYVYRHKDKWNSLKELLKLYYIQSPEYLDNKIYVVSQLLKYRDVIDMPELVLPSSLVYLDDNVCPSGFLMPWIESNVNMSLILNNPKVNLKQKMLYLKEIFKILDKTMKIKELENNFFLGDIHEANFILDVDDQMIKAIDMDSAYINGSNIGVSKFLTMNFNLTNPESKCAKYLLDEDDRPIPDKNTTTLCFVYMLLNVLSGCRDSYDWSKAGFYYYLSFLGDNKIPGNLLDAISNVYANSPKNEFSEELLDEIDLRRDYSLEKMAKLK